MYLPNTSATISMRHKVYFKQIIAGLDSEFPFFSVGYLAKAREPNLPYYLPIAGGRKDGFIPSKTAMMGI